MAITAPTATSTPPISPHIRRATSASGALDALSCSAGNTPMVTADTAMYTQAASSTPKIVARGMVRTGSTTSPAGTVADSRPRKAHSVTAAAAEIAARSDWPLRLITVKLAGSTHHQPSTPISSSGTSLSTVVSTCTAPASFTPRTLIRVSSQMATSAVSRL